jgi:hypothetical protein
VQVLPRLTKICGIFAANPTRPSGVRSEHHLALEAESGHNAGQDILDSSARCVGFSVIVIPQGKIAQRPRCWKYARRRGEPMAERESAAYRGAGHAIMAYLRKVDFERITILPSERDVSGIAGCNYELPVPDCLDRADARPYGDTDQIEIGLASWTFRPISSHRRIHTRT